MTAATVRTTDPQDARGGEMSKNTEALEHRLLTTSEVASLFRVDPKTVTRWAKEGRLSAVRTLGGHRRYHKEQIDTILGTINEEQD
jgi:excisionase family DNA binding protein